MSSVIEVPDIFIGGNWVEPCSTERVEVRFSFDGSLVGTAPLAGRSDIDKAVAAARQAFDVGPWPRSTPEDRRTVLERFAEMHAPRCEEFAAFISGENAAPLWSTTAIQQGVAAQNAAYLEAAKNYPWEVKRRAFGGQHDSVLRSEPVGVVAIIIPWNAPHQSALAKLFPALLAGCTAILKLAPETALSGQLLGDMFMKAGLPEGVLSILVADRDDSEYLVAHPDVDKIAFTGSSAAGRKIAAVAGGQLKRFSLELGGKSAAILLPDADFDVAAATMRYAGLFNSGQSCVAQTRILVPREHQSRFVEALAADLASLTVGDPREPGTFVGPLVAERQQQRAWHLIEQGVAEGAKLALGGPGMPDGLDRGAFVRPTLFYDVDNATTIAREEVFGPVLSVIPYDDEDHAVAIANDSPYGLAGGIWSADMERALGVARRVRTGTLSINGAHPDFSAPFGGYKQSGIGREFGSAGIAEYVEQKAITL